MTTDDVTKRVLDALVRVAPDVDPASVRPEASLRDEHDLDSMDFLNFVIGLHDAFGIDIPEADYPLLGTLAGAVRYLREHGAVDRAAETPAPSRPTHRFEGALRWERGGEGVAPLNHTVTFEGRPPLAMSAPPQFHGDRARIAPEELFVAAVASCQLLTYLTLAARAGVTVVLYEDRPVATLGILDRRMRVTEVALRPRITLAPGGDAATARRLVESAHDACFVSNSITAPVRIEPEIVLA